MKPLSLLFTCALLISTALPALAQKVDYRTFDVIAKSGNIFIVVKDSDYRMLVGSINKPKTVFLLGYSKEQASLKIKRLIRICGEDKYIKENRRIFFCGNVLHCYVKDKEGQEQYTFVREDDELKFVLEKRDLLVIKEDLDNLLQTTDTLKVEEICK